MLPWQEHEAYGVIGGVLLLITLLYFGGLVLLLGIVLNAILGERTDDLEDKDGLATY